MEGDLSDLKEQLLKACDLNDREKSKRTRAEADCEEVAKNFELLNTQHTALQQKAKDADERVAAVEAQLTERQEVVKRLEGTIVNQTKEISVSIYLNIHPCVYNEKFWAKMDRRQFLGTFLGRATKN